jgi:putative IMPACT (imprinted ancient) family translation regulator
VVVVRYFGGTKLGVGGLVTAYRSAAKMALENAVIVERTLMEQVSLQFDYVHMDKVMRIIKENDLDITSQTMELDCLIQISVRKNNLFPVLESLKNLRCVKIKKIK